MVSACLAGLHCRYDGRTNHKPEVAELVASGLARQAQVQLAYAIGVAQPVSLRVETFGTGVLSDEKLTQLLRRTCDMTPAGIIRKFDLRRPIYAPTAISGHFGNETCPWEKTDLADTLKALSAEQ